MKTFEYQQFEYYWSPSKPTWVEWLNELGKRGWELCDAVRDYDKRITWCIFKKEVNAITEPTEEEL